MASYGYGSSSRGGGGYANSYDRNGGSGSNGYSNGHSYGYVAVVIPSDFRFGWLPVLFAMPVSPFSINILSSSILQIASIIEIFHIAHFY